MKKGLKILLGFIIVIAIIWLSLEPIVLRYLNKKLDNIEGYKGHIEDVDIFLLVGKIGIQGLVLETAKDGFTRPFLSLPETRASIDWKALFKGRIVGQLEMDNPAFNFEIEPSKENNVNPDVNWVDVVKDIGVLDLNKLRINNGKISYLDRSTSKPVEINIQNINLYATNLSTVENKEKLLPSTLHIDAITDGMGKFLVNAQANLLKQVPDMDAEISINDVDLTGFNDAFQEYSKLKLRKGGFELYSEIALKDSILSGYLKPVLLDLSFISLEEKQKNLLTTIKQGAAEIAKNILENNDKQQVASKIPIEGKITSVDGAIWKSIWSLLKNAFFEPLTRRIDESISIKDAKNN